MDNSDEKIWLGLLGPFILGFTISGGRLISGLVISGIGIWIVARNDEALGKSGFVSFLVKYKILKKWLYTFLLLFILQHSKLSGTAGGGIWIKTKDKYAKYLSYDIYEQQTANTRFYFKSLVKNDILITKKIKVKNYKIQRDFYNSPDYYFTVEPDLIDIEMLYIKATFKDMQTIFLLSFLFDYDKLFEDIEK